MFDEGRFEGGKQREVRREQLEDDDGGRRSEAALVDPLPALAGGILVTVAIGVYVATGVTPYVVPAASFLAGGVVALVDMGRGGTVLDAVAAPVMGIAIAFGGGMAAVYAAVLPAAMAARVPVLNILLFTFPVMAVLGGVGNRAVERVLSDRGPEES